MSPTIKAHTRGIGAIVLLLIFAGIYVGTAYRSAPLPVMCTMDAKQCPDGSYVGRVGPSCNFAACPVVVPPLTTEQLINKELQKIPASTTSSLSAIVPTTPSSVQSSATTTQPITVSATVRYSASGFLPGTTTIKQTQAVDFINASNASFWLELNADYHDVDFPDFNSRSVITPGNKFTVIFPNAGTWHYHNKIATSTTGVIVVQAVATSTKAGSVTATTTAPKGTMKFN